MAIGCTAIIWSTWSRAEQTPSGIRGDADAKNDSLSAVDYAKIAELREDIGFRNEDLAAMGLSKPQAAHVLSELRIWYEQHKGELSRIDAQLVAAKQQLRYVSRQINIGPKDPALIARVPELRDAIIAQSEARAAWLDELVASLEADMKVMPRSTWQTIRKNRSLAPPYRFVPNITPLQQRKIYRAHVKAARLARGGAIDRATASKRDETLLTMSQRRIKSEAMQNFRQCMPGVLEASQEVCPVPDSLQPPEILVEEH
jgi:hypothetical protein